MEISERPVCPQFSQFSPDHLDWLGSSRFMSNPHQNTAVGAVAYAPFGESYNKTSAMRLDFTDQFQDSNIANTYDFPARKMNVVQGRWLSPDPGGLAAMDLTNPQTFNRYAYVGNNPLAAVDPLGLCDEDVGNDCGGGGAGGVPGYCPPSMEYCGDPPFPPIGVGGGDGGGGLGAGAGSPPAAPSPVPSPTNPNGPPSFGDPFTDPTPTEGGWQADYTFHTLVLWPFLAVTPLNCHFPNLGCFVFYGNWGGPGWSGGQFKPLETLMPQQVSQLSKPIDAQDTCYEEHDWCYSRTRTGQGPGFGSCDFQLQQCLHLVNQSGQGDWHSWLAEPIFSACELNPWRFPCHM